MDNKYIFGAVIVVVSVVLSGFFIKPVQNQTVLGSVVGPDVSFRMFFHDNVNVGGGVLATSSTGTVTYTAANIANSRLIQHIAASATTGTLPTAANLSAIGFLPNVGDSQVVFIQASTTKITIAGNTNVTLSSASSTPVISPGHIGRLEFVRLGATENRGFWVNFTSD